MYNVIRWHLGSGNGWRSRAAPAALFLQVCYLPTARKYWARGWYEVSCIEVEYYLGSKVPYICSMKSAAISDIGEVKLANME
jgi:hypothetical protein